MKTLLILFSLFPFLHDTTYTITPFSCKQDEIIVEIQGQKVQLDLFNIKMKDKTGWNTTCDLITNANKVTIQIDKSSAINNPLPAYVFADEVLLQEELIKLDKAYIEIKNPEYTYEAQMEKAQNSIKVVADITKVKKEGKGSAKVAPMFLGAMFILWCFMTFYLIRKRKTKVLHKKTED